jgi:hypothetical protein
VVVCAVFCPLASRWSLCVPFFFAMKLVSFVPKKNILKKKKTSDTLCLLETVTLTKVPLTPPTLGAFTLDVKDPSIKSPNTKLII